MQISEEHYRCKQEIAWCPGCGNHAILGAVKKALVELQLPPHRVVIVTGIGQAPKLPHYMKVNTFNGLHGREVAAATAIKLAANDLTVLVHAGDGGAYGEGGNHLTHAIRRNIDITVAVHDNHFYGLTKGQDSPTAKLGTMTPTHPFGVPSLPLNPLALAISQSASFVAQGTAAQREHLADLFKQAIQNHGFSLVNVLQPCVTFDKVYTFRYYMDHCHELGEDYDPTDRVAALQLAEKAIREDEIPIGVIYRQNRPTFDEFMLRGYDRPLRERRVDPSAVKQLLDGFQ